MAPYEAGLTEAPKTLDEFLDMCRAFMGLDPAGMGAEETESDLFSAKDSEIVSIHDDSLNCVLNGTGPVFEHANGHFLRPSGPHFPASQGHIKRPD